ncbi:MAG: hypothetical protein CBC48_12535 [bacterium TMED88]|nr:MAG: hypothetical protein CBC48_12535 [bacterium TMED88]
MNHKDFNKMLKIMMELDKLIKKYEDKYVNMDEFNEPEAKPIFIPNDIYDEMCKDLDIAFIDLLGIS